MKTKYKYIRLREISSLNWFVYKKGAKLCAGMIHFYDNEWVFTGYEAALNLDCLLDIVDFLKQLNGK